MSSPYYLAIDVRRSMIAAAVVDESQLATVGANGVQFGSGHTMPTAIHVGPDELAFGEEALTLGRAEPDRLIRDFVSGVEQNNTVFTVHGEEFAAADLYAWAVDDVASRVAASRGSRPAGIWTVVPAWWDDALIDTVADAFDRDGRRDVEFITAPEALASRYSRVDPSNSDLTLLVCDVDDQALQAAIVRQVPGTRARRIGIPVHAPISADGSAPDIDARAIDVVAQALAETGVPIDAVYAIVLSGPSDRLADFRQLLADRFGEPIDVERDPARAAAAGAALALAREKTASRPAAATIVGAGATTAAGAKAGAATAAAPAWYRRPVAIGVGAAAVVSVVAVASAFAIGGIRPSETESPASGVTAITPANQSTLTSPTPSATAQPSPDAAVPPPAADPAVPEPPRAPVNPRVQVPSAPVVAPAPADPPPVVAPAPAPVPPAEPDPTPTPDPTVDPTPTPEPTIPEPEPTLPEPEPTIPAPAPTVPEPAPTVPESEITNPE